ncbi:MAG: DUF4845 domain-containing protein [Acidithiobacillus sp.]
MIRTKDQRQAGISLLGLLFWMVLLVLIIAFVVKIMPVYYDYWSLESIVTTQAREARPQSTEDEIRYDLNRRLGVAMIDIPQKDIQIVKDGNAQPIITVDYDKVVPLVGNVSLLIHFHAVGK